MKKTCKTHWNMMKKCQENSKNDENNARKTSKNDAHTLENYEKVHNKPATIMKKCTINKQKRCKNTGKL